MKYKIEILKKYLNLVLICIPLVFMAACSDSKESTQEKNITGDAVLPEDTLVEEKTPKPPVTITASEVEPPTLPRIDTLKIEGTLIKINQTGNVTKNQIMVDIAGEAMEFNYPATDKAVSLQDAINKKVQVVYHDIVSFYEFDITLDGVTIHEMSEFEPTDDAPFKWSKVEGVLSADSLSHGTPRPISITEENGRTTIINSYINQSHLDNNGKVVTAYYGEERLHDAISISVVEQATYHSPFLGVWGTGTPIIIAERGKDGTFSGKNGYYMYFGGDAGFIKADVKADSISGTNFSGKFTIKLISTDPPQFLYSDDGRGHFEPIVDRLHEKVVSSNAKLLIGKWRSKDDPKNVIEYTPYDLINYYDEKLIDSEPYCLSPKCMNSAEVSLPPSNKHDYISVIDSDMCWNIVSIDDNHLTLSFMGRGNSLEYNRIK